MSGQNWRTEVDAQDYLGHQKKRIELEQRRPVVRKASDLVGPGIDSEAVRITDYNDILATFNGYYSSAPGALNAPSEDEPFVGTTVSDSVLGGRQTFVGLESAYEYTRTFVRNASDASAISWGIWEVTERVPASATSRESVETPNITSQGSQLLRPPLISTIGAAGSYSRTKTDIYVQRPGVYAGYLRIEGPRPLKLTNLSLIVPDRDGSKTLTFGPLKCKFLTSIPFTFWTTGESQEIRVYVSHNNEAPQAITWKDFTIVRVGDVPGPGLGFDGAFEQADGGTVIGDPAHGDPDQPDPGDIRFRQDSFTLTANGAQDLTLVELPLPGSEHLYWNGLYQREDENWTRTDLASNVVSLLAAPVPPQVGDRVDIEYAYLQQPYVYEPLVAVTPLHVGLGTATASYSGTVTSLALPAGTQAGDLLVVSLLGGYTSDSTAEGSCSDPRVVPLTTASVGGRRAGVWVGYADGSGTPLAIRLRSTYSGIGQFSLAAVTAWRGVDGATLEWEPTQVAGIYDRTSTTEQMPGLDGDLSGAICVYYSDAGLGGVYGDQNWSKAPAYTVKALPDNAYVEIDMAITTANPVDAQTTPNIDTGSSWSAQIIGLKKQKAALA